MSARSSRSRSRQAEEDRRNDATASAREAVPSVEGGGPSAPDSPATARAVAAAVAREARAKTASLAAAGGADAVVLKAHIVARLSARGAPRSLQPRAPPPFSGDSTGDGAAPLDEWLRTVLTWLDAGGAGAEKPARQCAIVAQLFSGAAQAWWHLHIDADTAPASLPALDVALHARFMPLRATTATRAMLHSMRQGDQPLQAYTSSFQAAATQLPSMAQDEAVHYFVSGLTPTLRSEVFREQPATLAEAVQWAVRCDALAHSAASMGGTGRSAPKQTAVAAIGEGDSDDDGGAAPAAAKVRARSKSRSRRANAGLAEIAAIAARAAVDAAASSSGEQRRGGRSGDGGGGGGKGCPRCGKGGHRAADCPLPPRCFRCQETGHYASDCTAPAPVAKRGN